MRKLKNWGTGTRTGTTCDMDFHKGHIVSSAEKKGEWISEWTIFLFSLATKAVKIFKPQWKQCFDFYDAISLAFC